ncbi:MAG: M3 family metallopeptidase [Bacteroidales bacterium]|nr:M3 family metallopeptidase [Bacteroidales bacterium]
MKRKSFIMSLVVATVVLSGACKKKTAENPELANNPFMKEWNTPYGVPPFEEIKTTDYLPAIQEGMRQQMENIQAICDSKEEPTFANTIIPYEYSGELLTKVSSVFMNLAECMNSPEMEKLSDTIFPLLTRHGDDIMLNAKLFERIKAVYNNREKENLNDEQMRLLEVIYKDFERGGANVPADKQARFREINEKLSALTLKFGNNVLGATNDYVLFVDNEEDLKGLTENQLATAKETADGMENAKGKYAFTIHLPSMEPFLQNCQNRELRKKLWTAYSTRCLDGNYSNKKIINEIVNLRLEKAKILGFDNYANYVLDDCMAKNADNVYELLMKVWEPALAKAKEEATQYQKMMAKDGISGELQPYDWRYYSEKLRKEKYDLNDDDIRPYLALDSARKGLFYVCERLYGLTFKENNEIPVYHKDVKAYEVIDNNEVIAVVYMDFFPRESKRSGAWMTNFREQYYDRDGNNHIPVVSLVFNFTKPVGDKPAMLNIDETQTLYHEFGHALHSILSRCHYPTLSGTNVPRDFVEMPSQFMEHFAFEPEVLKVYAHHYKTGELIPDALVKKIEAAATYGQGFINTELLAASILDMDYHTVTSPVSIKLPDYENQQMDKIGLISSIISRYRSPYFQHIFAGGYGAGYYSYTWSAVLDNDAYQCFKDHGIFDPATATSFRTNILEKGNTADAMTLYIAFRGQEPSIEPLLKNRGLK